MVLYGLAIIVENLFLSLRGKRVGKITDWAKVAESAGDSTIDVYYPSVHFEVGGRRFSFQSENGFAKRKWALGSAVPILYKEADPQHLRMSTTPSAQ